MRMRITMAIHSNGARLYIGMGLKVVLWKITFDSWCKTERSKRGRKLIYTSTSINVTIAY